MLGRWQSFDLGICRRKTLPPRFACVQSSNPTPAGVDDVAKVAEIKAATLKLEDQLLVPFYLSIADMLSLVFSCCACLFALTPVSAGTVRASGSDLLLQGVGTTTVSQEAALCPTVSLTADRSSIACSCKPIRGRCLACRPLTSP